MPLDHAAPSPGPRALAHSRQPISGGSPALRSARAFAALFAFGALVVSAVPPGVASADVTASGAAPGTLPAAADDAVAGGEYVALGDSFSAGGGAGDYLDTTCRRSKNAYPYRWAEAHKPTTFKFVACGGSRIPDLRVKQLPAVGPNSTLISIGIGGNDSRTTVAMLVCKDSTDNECESALSDAADYVQNQLGRQLDRLYSDIKTRAPKAKVIVVGYPYLYEEGGLCGAMSVTKRAMVRRGADVLNDLMAERAQAAGFSFVEARPAFAGHEACANEPWIDSFNHHPNAKGQIEGYLPAFSDAAAAATSPS